MTVAHDPFSTPDKRPALPAGDTGEEAWKIFRIMAEFVEGFEKLAGVGPSVSVFGSARIAPDHPYYGLAERIGRTLSDAGFAVVTGGGPGLMEAVSRGAQGGRSPSVGLNIQLPEREPRNAYQDVSLAFRHFFARKVMFVQSAAAFVVLPGGFGTLDECFEIITLIQTGKTRRVPVLLVGRDYWQGLLDWIDTRLLPLGTIAPEDRRLYRVADDPETLLEEIFAHYHDRGFAPTEHERRMLFEL